jgi:hypothetical protein
MRGIFVRSRRRSWIRPDGSLRRWHPGLWWCAVVAIARAVGLLDASPNGHGRVTDIGSRRLQRNRQTKELKRESSQRPNSFSRRRSESFWSAVRQKLRTCFSKATPSGRIEMQIDNPVRSSAKFYVDFTPVD